MIYKNDPSKKTKFFIHRIVKSIFYLAVYFLIAFCIHRKIDGAGVFIGVTMAVFYVLIFFRMAQRYDNTELELTETELIIRYKKSVRTYRFADLSRVNFYPTLFSKNQIILYFTKWSTVIINDYTENYEDIKNKILSIKEPSEKNERNRRKLNCLVALPFAVVIYAFTQKNLVFITVSSILVSLDSIFIIYIYIKSSVEKNRKIFTSILYSFIGLMFLYVSVSNGNLCKNFKYRKNIDGETVLMKIDFVTKYDESGNVVYSKGSDGKYIYRYDKRGNEIYFKDCNSNYWEKNIYENDKLLKSMDSNKVVTNYDYDKSGNKIHCKSSDGHESWYEYDGNDTLIHMKELNGEEKSYKCNDVGNVTNIHTIKADGTETDYTVDYDSHGNRIYVRDENGNEYFSRYDENDFLIYRNFYGRESFYSNNEEGRPIKIKSFCKNYHSEENHEYDSAGNLVYLKTIATTENDDGTTSVEEKEFFYTYDEHGNCIRIRMPGFKDEEYSFDYDKQGRIIRGFSYTRPTCSLINEKE